MLTAEVRVNGALIGFLYTVNRGIIDEKGTALYSVEYYEPGGGKLRSCNITHTPREGALVLLKRAISGVLKEGEDGSENCY